MKNLFESKFSIIISPLILILFWEFLARGEFLDKFLFPGPLQTLREMLRLISSGLIIPDIFATLQRVASSFLIAAIVGYPFGMLIGSSKIIYRQTEKIIDFFRSFPATALFPISMLVFGVNDTSKISVAAFSSALIIIFYTAHGVRNMNRSRILAAKIMGANQWQIFSKIIFWEIFPHVIVALRQSLSLSLMVIIVMEMFIGTSNGLGKRLVDFQIVYNINGMYAILFCIGMIGYFLNKIFSYFESSVIHWNNKM